MIDDSIIPSSRPGDPYAGDLWFNKDSSSMYVWSGEHWVQMPTGDDATVPESSYGDELLYDDEIKSKKKEAMT